MGRVEQNKLQKKIRLMNTAFELYCQKGIARTSISDIVNKAGMAKGTFYLYFRDKYDLQEKLISHKAEQLFQHALTHSSYQEQPTLADTIIVITDDIIDQLAKNKPILRFINKNLSWGIFRRAMDKSEVDYTKIIQDVFPETVSVQRQMLLLYTIIELVGSTCYSIILDNDPVSIDEYRPYMNLSIRAIVEAQMQQAEIEENNDFPESRSEEAVPVQDDASD